MNSTKETYNEQRNDNKKHTTAAMIDSPTDFDVLCGKSRTCANHPGNHLFQRILHPYVSLYNISNKPEKMNITKQIVSTVESFGGRFLKYSRQEGKWKEISTLAARDKVSHAIRIKMSPAKSRLKESERRKSPADLEESNRKTLSLAQGLQQISRQTPKTHDSLQLPIGKASSTLSDELLQLYVMAKKFGY